jgi:hypothetical protein
MQYRPRKPASIAFQLISACSPYSTYTFSQATFLSTSCTLAVTRVACTFYDMHCFHKSYTCTGIQLSFSHYTLQDPCHSFTPTQEQLTNHDSRAFIHCMNKMSPFLSKHFWRPPSLYFFLFFYYSTNFLHFYQGFHYPHSSLASPFLSKPSGLCFPVGHTCSSSPHFASIQVGRPLFKPHLNHQPTSIPVCRVHRPNGISPVAMYGI